MSSMIASCGTSVCVENILAAKPTIHLLPERRRYWDELNVFWRGEKRCLGEDNEPQRGSP